MKQFFKAFAVAFGMYSKIPMPGFQWNSEDMKYHLCFFPFVGAVTGALEFLWYQFCCQWLPQWIHAEIPELLVLCFGAAIPFLVTGGFHVDGFMDTMDALHSYGDREKKLAIMKDPHTGAFAVISLIVYMLLVLGFGSVLVKDGGKAAALTLGFSFVISRALSGISVTFFPKARKEGMAVVESSTQNKPVTGTVLIGEGILAAALCILFTCRESWCGVAAVSVMLLVFLYYFFMSRKQFGGINGDLAGFFVCVSEGAGVIASAVCILVESLWN